VSEGKVHCRTMVFDGTMEYNTIQCDRCKFVNEILSVGDVSSKFINNQPHQLAMFISQKFDSQIFLVTTSRFPRIIFFFIFTPQNIGVPLRHRLWHKFFVTT
jgi:hypothetical protein